ncbi:MAG: DUF4230 domain-containing protein [Spirosomataceae bacterium]
MYRFLIRLLVLLCLVAGVIYAWENVKTKLSFWNQPDQTETDHNVVVREITALGKIELVKYSFRDVVEHEIVKAFLPNSKALLIVQGEAVGCINLSTVSMSDIATKYDTLIVHLPEPEICYVKIDHQKSKVYNTEYALLDEALLVEQAFKQAEGQLQKSALDMGILDQTKVNAEKMLKPILEKVSGKKVLIRYRMRAQLDRPK